MRIRVEYARDLDVAQWETRHAAGEVPDYWPYGLNRLGGHGHTLSAAVSFSGRRTTRVAGITSSRLGGIEWMDSMRRGIGAEDAELVLCQDERSGLPALLRERLRRGGRSVVTGSVWLSSGDGVTSIQRRLAHGVLPSAAAIWTYSHAEVDVLCATYGVPSNRVHPVDFGIDAEFFGAGGHGARRGVPLVVSAGNDRHRDFDTLAAALRSLRDAGAELEARVATTRWSAPHADRGWLQAGGTGARGIRSLYGEAAVVVVSTHPNLHVSGLTVTLEAMCSGVPVVVSATPGFAHYVDHGRTGLLVPPGDGPALAAAVRGVLANPVAARRMGQAAREAVLSRFTTGHLAAQLDDIARNLG